MLSNNKHLIDILKRGGIAVIPTDTIYGLSAQALEPKSAEKIYCLKKSRPSKPMIILISDIRDLKLFEIELDKFAKEILSKVWPGKVSVILPCPKTKFSYLHRDTNTLAFRLPDRQDLRQLIKITGPLISTSANPEGLPPASTIEGAKKYFGKNIDIYIDEGKLESLPSTLISISDGKVKVIRYGEADLSGLEIGKTL